MSEHVYPKRQHCESYSSNIVQRQTVESCLDLLDLLDTEISTVRHDFAAVGQTIRSVSAGVREKSFSVLRSL